MTEQDYDDEIAPLLAEIANRVKALGGSMIARVEWEPGEAGITTVNVTADSGVAQRLANIAALCGGNLDSLYISAAKQFDLSPTMVGHKMGWTPPT